MPDIILHGTATLALAFSRVVDEYLDGDPTRVTRLGGRYTGMVLMLSTLTLAVVGQRDGLIAFEVRDLDGSAAFSNGYICRP